MASGTSWASQAIDTILGQHATDMKLMQHGSHARTAHSVTSCRMCLRADSLRQSDSEESDSPSDTKQMVLPRMSVVKASEERGRQGDQGGVVSNLVQEDFISSLSFYTEKISEHAHEESEMEFGRAVGLRGGAEGSENPLAAQHQGPERCMGEREPVRAREHSAGNQKAVLELTSGFQVGPPSLRLSQEPLIVRLCTLIKAKNRLMYSSIRFLPDHSSADLQMPVCRWQDVSLADESYKDFRQNQFGRGTVRRMRMHALVCSLSGTLTH